LALKIAVLVKEVPDAAVQKKIDPGTGRIDRSGEKNLNPYDTHAIECAVQLKEGNEIEVDEIVAVTMGPDSAVRALHKAVSLGADRSIHLSDDALAGSDVNATGYALAKVLEAEAPAVRRRRVLHRRGGRRRPPQGAVALSGDQA
jgi:electron transfer flavoprotein beta subunit